MKKIAILLLCYFSLLSCMHKRGSGNVVSQTKDVGNFKGINVSNSFKVELKNGPVTSVVVEADDNLVKYVEVKVVNNILRISLDNINVSDAHLKVFITAPAIEEIKTSASAEIVVKGSILSEKVIRLNASSSSEIKATLDAPLVEVDASSGSEITLSGRTRDLDVVASSGADINARELLTENSTATASSGADISVNASISVNANASSGGNITYRGAAASIKKENSSGGDINKEN